jgi:tight adherence protein B
VDYNVYQFKRKERILVFIQGMIGAALLIYVFYNSVWIVVPGTVAGGMFYIRYQKKERIKKRKQQLANSFKDLMESMMAALTAGYSLENSIREARRDLSLLYSKDSYIMIELCDMCRKLDLSFPVEKLFESLGERSTEEDICTFSQVLSTAHRSGGNLVKIMGQTSNNIREKIELKNEIETMISGKKLESRCMCVIPLLIILYLRIFSPGFLDPLYGNLIGACIMTVFLAIYAGGFMMAKKIMDISF